ncbi:beta-phosphoglucomutase [Gottschalkiaceae bacterium SANA]|nr:beta-phosphoglucomutase [Gottschalkiaceae bacterium SANA]
MGNRWKAVIFDLDGVIVDTAKYHYLAWKRLAEELGISFTLEDNERLKGVSRMASLDILLSLGKRRLPETEKLILAEEKNAWYVEMIDQLTREELLPGAEGLLRQLRADGVKIALGSASKNAERILNRLEIGDYFDARIDGTKVSRAKPDPEVFLLAAKSVGVNPADCLVFEDAPAGVEAAKRANMHVVGIGNQENLLLADWILGSLDEINDEILYDGR